MTKPTFFYVSYFACDGYIRARTLEQKPTRDGFNIADASRYLAHKLGTSQITIVSFHEITERRHKEFQQYMALIHAKCDECNPPKKPTLTIHQGGGAPPKPPGEDPDVN